MRHADSAARLGLIVPISRPRMLRRDAAVDIVEPDDVVLTDIVAALHFDQAQRGTAGIFQAVFGTQWNVGRLIRRQQHNSLIDRYFGGSADNHPVLASMMVHLQRQRCARPYFDALDLEVRAFLQRRVRAPRARHRPMQFLRIVSAALQFVDDVFHFLRFMSVAYQHSVRGVNDDNIF